MFSPKMIRRVFKGLYVKISTYLRARAFLPVEDSVDQKYIFGVFSMFYKDCRIFS
jgi:hypothetical protein